MSTSCDRKGKSIRATIQNQVTVIPEADKMSEKVQWYSQEGGKNETNINRENLCNNHLSLTINSMWVSLNDRSFAALDKNTNQFLREGK